MLTTSLDGTKSHTCHSKCTCTTSKNITPCNISHRHCVDAIRGGKTKRAANSPPPPDPLPRKQYAPFPQNEVSVILFFIRAPDIFADHLLPRVAVQLELPAGFNWLLGWGQLVMCLFFICSKEKWNSTCWNFSFDLFLFPSFEGCSSCFYICGFAVVHLSCQIHMFSFHRFHHVSSISPLADVFLVCTCAPCSFYTMGTRAFEVSFWDVPALMGKSSGHP